MLLSVPLCNATLKKDGIPKGIRTPVTAVKGRCPRPLDDGDIAKRAAHFTMLLLICKNFFLLNQQLPDFDAWWRFKLLVWSGKRDSTGLAFQLATLGRSGRHIAISQYPTFQFGAGNEIRTRDPNLGKVVLYQLSYSR